MKGENEMETLDRKTFRERICAISLISAQSLWPPRMKMGIKIYDQERDSGFLQWISFCGVHIVGKIGCHFTYLEGKSKYKPCF